MTQPTIAVSIVTYNHEDDIDKCINSLLSQTISDFDIFVVDNNSSDDTSGVIKSITDRRIKFTQLEENTGFCGGHNYTINKLDVDYVLLVNPDIQLSHDYIENALKFINEDPTIGTLCGLLLQSSDGEDAVIDSAGMNKKRDGRYALRFHRKYKKDVSLHLEEVPGADGALPLYNMKMVNDIKINGNFFDEMFFAHKEDWDISWRSTLFGWKTVFNPDFVAIHPRSFKPGSLDARNKMSSVVKYHAIKNQLLLIIKNEQQLWRNILFIFSRQIIIFFYVLFLERKSLKAYRFVFKHVSEVLRTRRIIQERIKTGKTRD
jgi:GT2 family glycosyltransferase